MLAVGIVFEALAHADSRFASTIYFSLCLEKA